MPLPPLLRQTLRALRRAPGFTAAAVLCIALGTGATTAVASALSAVLLRPLPVRDLDRVVALRADLGKLELTNAELSPPEIDDLAARRDLFGHVAGFAERNLTLTTPAGSVRYRAVRTLGDPWGLLGARPVVGRLFRPDEGRDGRHRVVVLSDGVWREQFGADPRAVGRTILLNDEAYEIVGVLPPALRYPRWAQLYTPYPVDSTFARQRGRLVVTALARLAPGVTLERVRAALPAAPARFGGGDPALAKAYADARYTLRAEPFVAFDAGQLRPVLLVLAGAVGLVVLVACVNVGGLQLVRAMTRARELAVRTALGAGRAAVLRPLLAEGAAVAAIGGTLGLALGWAVTRVFVHLAPPTQLALQAQHVDVVALAGAAAATMLAAVLGAVLPARRALRTDVREAIADGTRGGTTGRDRQRALRGIVVAQVALSVVLLAGSTVLLRSLAKLMSVDPGFRPERVMTAVVPVPFASYAKVEASNALYDRLLARLRAMPGVVSVGLTNGLPLTGAGDSSPFTIVGRDTTGQGAPPHAHMLAVGGDYFRAMGIPLLRGRAFGAEESTRPTGEGAAMSVLVDEALVRRYFPNEDPIGKRLNQGPDAVIVGIVGTVRKDALADDPYPTIYYDYRQGWWKGFTVVVRSTLDDAQAIATIRGAVRDLDPRLPVVEIAAMPEVVRRSVGAHRFGATVLGALAGVALLLALLGIYGALSYVVAQRARELGIRAALGAGRAELARLVLGGGARLAAAGVAVGVVGYLVAARALASQVYGVGPRDPLTLVGVSVLLGAAVLGASWLPARRAARVDPAVALRAE